MSTTKGRSMRSKVEKQMTRETGRMQQEPGWSSALLLPHVAYAKSRLPERRSALPSSVSLLAFMVRRIELGSEFMSVNQGHNLMKLLLKNAWLSVDGLRIMPNLTHLTLEFIRLDDEDLSKLNECFPCLQILNLIGVGGLKDPNIDLHQLKICHWERVIGSKVIFFQVFTENIDINSLELEIPISTNSYELFEAVKPEYLLQLFIGINEAKLAPRFSREMMHFLD
ncbi:hypothetical protein ABZP36_003398 [Zizania latifolia]